ncbi:hypothetical protein F3Y22_tig00110819pilonHSYRG00174 [Hibiscus syriacus]|uniref:RNase H type-1 domain-containing protein n=1 Tax=Hibiscus syriacus TaxID=106335 RepID=A0A6A2ZMR0_HIBSY|nr:hypothetical protein F3Y22_tig00110819pilonHSYRG00174 [Hibiscus syriacus]
MASQLTSGMTSGRGSTLLKPYSPEYLLYHPKNLGSVSMGGSSTDCIRWCGSSSGWLKPKDFCNGSGNFNAEFNGIWKLAWSNLAPPKVEAFARRAVHGRIPTRIELSKRSSIRSSVGLIVGIFPSLCRTTSEIFTLWVDSPIDPRSKDVWKLAFISFSWSIWLFRDEVIFNNKKLYENQLFDIALLRTSHWCKARWPHSFKSVLDLLICPSAASISLVALVKHPICLWSKPPSGFLKFNVDGAVRGSFGAAGVGGILRDHKGKILAEFSKRAGFLDPSAPSCFSADVQHFHQFCSNNRWSLRYVPRACNADAHRLAKAGIG